MLDAAFAMLDEHEGPVLADFRDDAVTEAGAPLQASEVQLTQEAIEADLATEVTLMRRYWEQRLAATGRTAVGLSGLRPQQFFGVVRFLEAYLHDAGADSPSRPPDVPIPTFIRFCIEDLRVCCTPRRAFRRIRTRAAKSRARWLLGETGLGVLLRRLKDHMEASDDPEDQGRGLRYRALMTEDHVDRVRRKAHLPHAGETGVEAAARIFRYCTYLEPRVAAAFRKSRTQPHRSRSLSGNFCVRSDSHVSAGTLAASTICSTGTMTNRLDRLERAGLIRRHDDPGDRRGVLIELSAKGRKAIVAALAARDEIDAALTPGLTVAERRALAALPAKGVSCRRKRPRRAPHSSRSSVVVRPARLPLRWAAVDRDLVVRVLLGAGFRRREDVEGRPDVEIEHEVARRAPVWNVRILAPSFHQIAKGRAPLPGRIAAPRVGGLQ